MRPDAGRFLEVAAAHLMLRTAPALADGYQQASTMVLGTMLMEVKLELERSAARRVEENEALRALFTRAAPVVEDSELRRRLEEAARGEDASLVVSDLERGNAALRALLIELHAQIEELESPAARAIDGAIWRELVASTERRRSLIGPF